MNIFVLHTNPKIAAQMSCDKHVVKMVSESVQMLSTTMHSVGLEGPWKKTHANHPCTIWTRESLQNYQWLWDHANALGEEYTHRYNKKHKSHLTLTSKIPYNIDGLSNKGLTPFPQAMPDEYKDKDIVKAYRKFYLGEKASFATWKNRTMPEWFAI